VAEPEQGGTAAIVHDGTIVPRPSHPVALLKQLHMNAMLLSPYTQQTVPVADVV
jgi:hypothetical protein